MADITSYKCPIFLTFALAISSILIFYICYLENLGQVDGTQHSRYSISINIVFDILQSLTASEMLTFEIVYLENGVIQCQISKSIKVI